MNVTCKKVVRGGQAALLGQDLQSKYRSSCTALSIVKQGGLMAVANVDDSQVVLDTTSDDDAITPSSSSST
uniref:Uncharacterized protein n=1 Tax=Zea mays TaxID=4577 RepID=A0A804ML71_MAIZE